jgi:hypothetical protein
LHFKLISRLYIAKDKFLDKEIAIFKIKKLDQKKPQLDLTRQRAWLEFDGEICVEKTRKKTRKKLMVGNKVENNIPQLAQLYQIWVERIQALQLKFF